MKRVIPLLTALLFSSHLPAASPNVSILVGDLTEKEASGSKFTTGPLNSPFGVAFDSTGNMVIVELAGGRVHRLTPKGKLTTIAGNGTKGYRGDGGPAKQATFDGMHNVAIAPDDSIYIADSWNHCIRRIDPETGVITTIAGTGKAGFSGDGGPATKATFNFIMCITLNPAGDTIYVADLKNRRIRSVDLTTGIVATVAGNGEKGTPADGALATQSPLVDPRAVVPDSQGNIYVLERNGNVLRMVKSDGRIYTVVGTGKRGDRDGPARQAELGSPKHVCVDARDNVYIADDTNALIRKYNPRTKSISTVLGRGKSNPPLFLKRPHGVCIQNGQLIVVDTGNNRILKLE
jgi:DNA-binding beta-propeller fold protein YncE